MIEVRRLLRGADAVYVDSAALLDAELVTRAGELVKRGGGSTPSAWPSAHP